MDDPEINRAIFQPGASRLARRVFNFINGNSNLVTSLGGMSPVVTGLDKSKLYAVAKGKGLRLSKYESIVDLYEDEMLRSQKNSN